VLLAPRRPDADGAINDAPLWRQSHVDGLEIHSGLDAKSVEVRVEPLSCPVAADFAQPGQEFPVGVQLAGDAEFRSVIRGDPMRSSSSRRSRTPQVKAPCAPPLCRARLISLVSPP
jgi:hypothetical protein